MVEISYKQEDKKNVMCIDDFYYQKNNNYVHKVVRLWIVHPKIVSSTKIRYLSIIVYF